MKKLHNMSPREKFVIITSSMPCQRWWWTIDHDHHDNNHNDDYIDCGYDHHNDNDKDKDDDHHDDNDENGNSPARCHLASSATLPTVTQLSIIIASSEHHHTMSNLCYQHFIDFVIHFKEILPSINKLNSLVVILLKPWPISPIISFHHW